MVDNLATTRSTKPRFLPLLFPILACAGLLVTLLLYHQTFREATIDLTIGRAAAEQRALTFLSQQGVAAGDHWRSVSFQTDTTAQDYLIASSGLAELDALARQDLKLASWHVRLFTPLDPEEWSVDVSSRTGRIFSYQHTIKEEAPGATLPITAAEQLALHALAARPGGGPAPFELRPLARRVTRQPNRIDQTFTWERPALRRGDATYRYSVTISGDQVGRFDEYYNIPESWRRLARWHGRRGALLNTIGWTAAYALLVGLGLAWLWAASRKLLRVRFAATLLAAVALVALATALNSIPLFLSSLPTDVSVPAFLADQLGAYAGTALTVGAAIVIAGMAGEVLVWTALDKRQETRDKRQEQAISRLPSPVSRLPVSLSKVLTPRGLASAPIARCLLIGICVGVAQLGYVTLFYWAGQRWFGVWAPVDPNYDDILSTPLPWLYAMALGLLPAIGEELVFRLGGISLLQRLTGMPRLSVVMTAVIWAALHTTYSQQPFFIRLVELTIVGVVFGVLFLRYGVLTSIAAHYTYNAALMAPLLVQGSWATRAGAMLAIGGAALLLLPALARRLRGQPLEDARALVAPPTADPRARTERSAPYLALRRRRRLLLPALAGLAVWLLAEWLLPQPPLLRRPLTRTEATTQAETIAQRLGLSTSGLYGAAYPDASLLNLDAEYLRDHPGTQDATGLVAELGQRAAWRVRFSQWDRDDTLTLWLGAQGELLALDRSLPEDAPGATILQQRAWELSTALLRDQRFDLSTATLVDSSTITRTNRVDHRFVWQSEQLVGAAAHPRVLVAVQGNQVATLSPFLYTPPEYRRERDRTTLTTMLTRDTLPLLPEIMALLLSGAGLLLVTRRPIPLRMMVACGLVGAAMTLLDGVLGLDAAQLAQPPLLIQGVTYAAYSAILSGTELALVAGGAALLWRRAFPQLPAIERQIGALFGPRNKPRRYAAYADGHHNKSPVTSVPLWLRIGPLRRDGCALGLALLPALLAFAALRYGIAADPGALRSPNGLGALAPAVAVLLEGALAALLDTLLLAGAVALLAAWRPLRPAALPLVALGAVLVATQPDRLPELLLALLAWPVALVLARLLRGNLAALALALWWAACLPNALELIALGHWWYAVNGVLTLLALGTPVLAWSNNRPDAMIYGRFE
jgi:hypothetical protein